MSYTALAHVATGDLATAALHNTFLDNFTSLFGPLTLYVDGSSFHPDLTNGCDAPTDQTMTAGNPLMSGCGFSGTVDQFAQFKLPFPKSWNVGTVTYRVRWTSPNANAGNVVFSLAGRGSSDGDSLDAAFGTAQFCSDTFQAVKIEHMTGTSAAITIAGALVKQDMLLFRFGRLATDGADTKTDKIFVEGIELFFSLDTTNDG